MQDLILGLTALISATISPVTNSVAVSPVAEVQTLAHQSLDLTKRAPNPDVNEVFSDNILLALHYFAHHEDFKLAKGAGPKNIDWEKVRQRRQFSLVLLPGEVFAFHENLAPEYRGLPVKTSGTRYIYDEGYKAVGGLSGNGVCHLASLLNWVAQEAGLEVKSPVNHNFAPVPGVPKKYGTAIRYLPKGGNSQNQNLYLKNNFPFPVEFRFTANRQKVDLKIIKYPHFSFLEN